MARPPDGFVTKVLKGKNCRKTAGLFAEFSRGLHFPEYFGSNWDALEECLADLEWLPARGYVLILTDAEEILRENEEEYATFLEILNDAGEAWGSGQARGRPVPFHALFAIAERHRRARSNWGIDEMDIGKPVKPVKKSIRSRSGHR
ncbi:hypothetical protein W02_22770 [Nitrospira sp. KM1]|nr:hypothetical protein W02_22770 [Nitrospira sp. KM1]